ncbi:MAG: hypothetical protein KC646_00155 [Candidatus Cloacimonetes bacterium]|nr:hypothetical protein [Candidatus Cloacimonadota bacterium]
MAIPKLKQEHIKVILSFFGLFFLLCSYYVIKPFRAGVFYKEFTYQTAPYLQLSCIVGSLLLTRAFTSFYKKLSSIHLVISSYFIMGLIHVLFYFLLGIGFATKPIAFVFCLWASIYFLLALAILWGNTNQIFSSKQAKVYYGFVLFGALSGSTCGSMLSSYIIDAGYLDYSLLFSAALMTISIVFIYFADHFNVDIIEQSAQDAKNIAEDKKISSGFVTDLKALFKKHYLLCIAVMVFSLTFSKTAFEYRTLPIIDQEISKKVLNNHFQLLDQGTQSNRSSLNVSLLKMIQSLKKLDDQQRLKSIGQFVKDHQLTSEPKLILDQYHNYQKDYQKQISFWHNQTQNYQNILAIIILLFGSSFILRKLGVGVAICLLPLSFFILLIITNFDVGLLTVQICKVIVGALDFSINNASKELLFVCASSEANLRFKPFIEGPIFRLGNACSALIFICLASLVGVNSQIVFLIFALIIVSIWFIKARDVAKQYHQLDALNRATPILGS